MIVKNNDAKQNKTRIIQFDALKGMAIILVVIGHIIDLNLDVMDNSMYRVLSMLINLVHMPVFIFVAGLFDSCDRGGLLVGRGHSCFFIFLQRLSSW